LVKTDKFIKLLHSFWLFKSVTIGNIYSFDNNYFLFLKPAYENYGFYNLVGLNINE